MASPTWRQDTIPSWQAKIGEPVGSPETMKPRLVIAKITLSERRAGILIEFYFGDDERAS